MRTGVAAPAGSSVGAVATAVHVQARAAMVARAEAKGATLVLDKVRSRSRLLATLLFTL